MATRAPGLDYRTPGDPPAMPGRLETAALARRTGGAAVTVRFSAGAHAARGRPGRYAATSHRGTGGTGPFHVPQGLTQLTQPFIGVLPHQPHTPGERVATTARHPRVDQRVQDAPLGLTQPGHH